MLLIFRLMGLLSGGLGHNLEIYQLYLAGRSNAIAIHHGWCAMQL